MKEIQPNIPQTIDLIPRQVAKIDVHDQETLEQAINLLTALNIQKDVLTRDKEQITKPLNESLKAVRDKYRPAETILEDSINKLRSSITGYSTKQEELARQEEQRILADKRTKTTTKIAQLSILEQPKQSITTQTANAKVTFTTLTKYRLVSTKGVPLQLLELNQSALKEFLKDPANELPEGIEVYQEKSLRNFR